MIETELAVLMAMVVFWLGVLVGEKLEAKAWEATSGDYLKRESGGRVFIVREDISPKVGL